MASLAGSFHGIGNAKKKHERDAELGFWFGVDPTGWGEGKKIGWLANLSRVQSQDRLLRGDFDPTDYEGVERLVMHATGNAAQARKARAEALKRFVEQQTRGR